MEQEQIGQDDQDGHKEEVGGLGRGEEVHEERGGPVVQTCLEIECGDMGGPRRRGGGGEWLARPQSAPGQGP